MSNQVDLNALRDLIHTNQASGDERPNDPDHTLFVDREGNIQVGADESSESRRAPLSKIPQEVFASRLERDRKTASRFLPANTRFLETDDGAKGWLYSIQTEYGDAFTLFAFYDGNSYQVTVITPRVEDYWSDPHTGHIFANGQICFGSRYGSGLPSLRDAFGKSVLWANGMSVATRTGKFPFSINN